MKSIRLFLFSALLIGTLSSCYTTRTNVGGFRETEGEVYTYSKAKQFYFFYGFFMIGHIKTETPKSGVCQVKTKFTIVDFLISGLTLGIINCQTIKVLAKKGDK